MHTAKAEEWRRLRQEYVPEVGDEAAEIAPGTLFEKLPEDWVCPECGEGKDHFIPA